MVKISPANTGDATRDVDSIPGSGRSTREGNGNPLQFFCLEKSMEGGAFWATVHGVTVSHDLATEGACTHTHTHTHTHTQVHVC